MKLGGELQPIVADIPASVAHARGLVLGLIGERAPEVFRDLLKPCNPRGLPASGRKNPVEFDFWVRFFLLHSSDPALFDLEVEKFGCTPLVRNTPLLAYLAYFHHHQREFDACVRRVASPEALDSLKTFPGGIDRLVQEIAVREFIPSAKALKNRPGAKTLLTELKKWSRKWNLSADWCLDFALECLATLKTDFFDSFRPPPNYLESSDPYWNYRIHQDGRAWKTALVQRNLKSIYGSTEFIEALPEPIKKKLRFRYAWPRSLCFNGNGFELIQDYFPNYQDTSKENFLKQTEEVFWAHLTSYLGSRWTLCPGKTSEIAEAITSFRRKLDSFVDAAHDALRPYTLPTPKKKDESHFRWFVDYQVNQSEFSEIAKKEAKSPRTIRDEAQRVSQLIALPLRKGVGPGRPIGSRTQQTGRGHSRRWD